MTKATKEFLSLTGAWVDDRSGDEIIADIKAKRQKSARSEQEKITPASSNTQWLDDTFALMDKAQASSSGEKWKRENLYRGIKLVNPFTES